MMLPRCMKPFVCAAFSLVVGGAVSACGGPAADPAAAVASSADGLAVTAESLGGDRILAVARRASGGEIVAAVEWSARDGHGRAELETLGLSAPVDAGERPLSLDRTAALTRLIAQGVGSAAAASSSPAGGVSAAADSITERPLSSRCVRRDSTITVSGYTYSSSSITCCGGGTSCTCTMGVATSFCTCHRAVTC